MSSQGYMHEDIAALELEEIRLLEIEEALAVQGSLAEFVRLAWHVVEPARPLTWNWHLDIICKGLERCTSRELSLLVICVPPGSMKSLLVSVFWPAWEWLTNPSERSLYLSGSDSVRGRDSRRCRAIIQSEWYEFVRDILVAEGTCPAWTLAHDQNQKLDYATTCQGQRKSVTVGGKIVGDRADKQVMDDPYDIKETQGAPDRVRERMAEVVDIWDDVLRNRVNDLGYSPRILIMQRVHQDDLAGVILERTDWSKPKHEHIVIACDFDPESEWNHPDDPRTEFDECFFPALFTQEALAEFTTQARSTQYNQKPIPKGGLAIEEDWCQRRWVTLPNTTRGTFLQTWDLRNGGKNKEKSSRMVGHLWFQSKDHPGSIYLVDEIRGPFSATETTDAMLAVQDRPYWNLAREKLVENKADARVLIPILQDLIPGLIPVEPVGAKEDRPEGMSPFFRAGNIILPANQPWVDGKDGYVEELTSAPLGKFDDRVDTTYMAVDKFLIGKTPQKKKKNASETLRRMVGRR